MRTLKTRWDTLMTISHDTRVKISQGKLTERRGGPQPGGKIELARTLVEGTGGKKSQETPNDSVIIDG
jgi:hypothetical protein